MENIKELQALAELRAKADNGELQPKTKKALAIADIFIDTAASLSKTSIIAYPPKRLFRKIDRRPLKRINKNKARLAFLMQPMMSAIQISQIATQAIPNYINGASDHPGGLATISGSATEIILPPKIKTPQ